MIIEPAKAEEIRRDRQQNRLGDEELPPPAYSLDPSSAPSSSRSQFAQSFPPSSSTNFSNNGSSQEGPSWSSQALTHTRSNGSGGHPPLPQIVLAPPNEESSNVSYRNQRNVSGAQRGLHPGRGDVHESQDHGAGPSQPYSQPGTPWARPSGDFKDLPMIPGQTPSADKRNSSYPSHPSSSTYDSDAWEPHAPPSGSSRSSIASSSQGPPQAWNRLPPSHDASSTTYAPFEPPLLLHSNSGHLSKGFPKLPPPCTHAPHPFATHDIRVEDWQQFLADIKKTANVVSDVVVKGVAPVIRERLPFGGLFGLVFDGAKNAIKATAGGTKPGTVVDDWNTFFFNPRRLNVTLLQGHRRLSGFSVEQHNAYYAREPSSASNASVPSRPPPRAWDPAYIPHVSASASQSVHAYHASASSPPHSASSSHASPPSSASLSPPAPYASHAEHRRLSVASMHSISSLDPHRENEEGGYNEHGDHKGKRSQTRNQRAREKADTQFTLVVEPF